MRSSGANPNDFLAPEILATCIPPFEAFAPCLMLEPSSPWPRPRHHPQSPCRQAPQRRASRVQRRTGRRHHQDRLRAAGDLRTVLLPRESGSAPEAVIEQKIVSAISVFSIGRILRKGDVKPHRSKYWLTSAEHGTPEFEPRSQAVLDLYAKPKRSPSRRSTASAPTRRPACKSSKASPPTSLGRRGSWPSSSTNIPAMAPSL